MRATIVSLATFAILACSAPLAAQGVWELDVRAGAAHPTQDIGDDALDTGFGFEATLAYRFLPHLAAYGGWDWRTFEFEEATTFAGEGVDLEETGYAFGLRFEHPFAGASGTGPAYRIHAGATVNHVELEDDAGDRVADSGHGLGWEAGAGVTFPLSDAWRLAPAVRYRSLSRDVDIDDVTTQIELRYVAAELGVTWRF